MTGLEKATINVMFCLEESKDVERNIVYNE